MTPINKNWTDENGNHAGGQSIGDNFTIVWQRGPLNDDGRNGAFLIEVLCACLRWMREPFRSTGYIRGQGFTILLAEQDQRTQIKTLIEVVDACTSQLEYYQNQLRFACDENQSALHSLVDAVGALQEGRHSIELDLDAAIVHLQMAQSALIIHRDRRAKAGTLGTHAGEGE